MTRYLFIKPTKPNISREAKAKVSRYYNGSSKSYKYCFEFYKTCKFFTTYEEMKNYIESNYSLIGWNGKPFNLPNTWSELFD